jgi:hypothetical protein
MSETKWVNPFDEENFLSGGGLWDGKVVVITYAKCEIERLTYGDGSPVINDRTGEQSVRNSLVLKGIAEDEEQERKESFSAGGSMIPSADGEGFIKANGEGQGLFHTNSEMHKLVADLRAGGFDVRSLWDEASHSQKFSRMVGAKLRFKAEPVLDKDGKVKKDKKGYDKKKFWPVEFCGYKEGKEPGKAPAPGALKDKAVEAVMGVLTENGGKVSRADLIRKLSTALHGDQDCNKILALVAKDEFHKDVPWTKDGTGYSL